MDLGGTTAQSITITYMADDFFLDLFGKRKKAGALGTTSSRGVGSRRIHSGFASRIREVLVLEFRVVDPEESDNRLKFHVATPSYPGKEDGKGMWFDCVTRRIVEPPVEYARSGTENRWVVAIDVMAQWWIRLVKTTSGAMNGEG